ncbi:MAG: hypothetical protein HOH04_13555 [Rhodospirillaceae bacterium]|jgi:hypothetical protein|nr:hypothetical protein [Rhodospirillaceae bacterium]
MGGFFSLISAAFGTFGSAASSSAGKAAANMASSVSSAFGALLGIDPTEKTSTAAQIAGIAASLGVGAAIVVASPAMLVALGGGQ